MIAPNYQKYYLSVFFLWEPAHLMKGVGDTKSTMMHLTEDEYSAPRLIAVEREQALNIVQGVTSSSMYWLNVYWVVFTLTSSERHFFCRHRASLENPDIHALCEVSPLIICSCFLGTRSHPHDNEPGEMLVGRKDGPTQRQKLQMGKGQGEERAKLSLRTNVRSTVQQVLLGKRQAN